MISLPGRVRRWERLPVRLQQRLRRRPVLAWTILAVTFLLVRAGLLPIIPPPEPVTHDEFSYLLAADTFAHGHLAGPTPPQPVAFESPQILVTPVYAAKYPPGQGLVLALGQLLFGHPYAGVLLSTASLIFLICWSASLWLPPQWAFASGGLAWVLLFLRNYWSESYWGGSVAACGGALVFGALGCAMRQRWWFSGVTLGVGAIVLYATRPYEGGMLCVTVGTMLLYLFWRSKSMERRAMAYRVFFPALAIVVFVLTPLALGYNYAVTGDPWEIPYLLHERQYSQAAVFWVQPTTDDVSAKPYSTERLRAFHGGWERDGYIRLRQTPWLQTAALQAGRILFLNVWPQFSLFSFLLVLLPWTGLGGRSRWLMALLAAGFLTLFIEVWVSPHYSAPFVAVQFVAIAAGVRARWYRTARTTKREVWIAAVMVLAMLTPIVFEDAALFKPIENQRAKLVRDLVAKGGRHLVLVNYKPGWSIHDEWVYNGYDLENSRILMAHSRNDHEDRELIHSFPGRAVWSLTLGPGANDIRLAEISNSFEHF